MNDLTCILLVSQSPRRRELLKLIGVHFEVLSADIDESRLKDESPESYVNRLARDKALAGLYLAGNSKPALGADTIVLLDGEILGKPESRSHARTMLHNMSGRDHRVLSAVALARDPANVEQRLNTTRVTFSVIPPAWIEMYSELDEPMDKAGAYAIQGLAGQWVSHIEGSYSGVMGLPLFETAELLRSAGVPFIGAGSGAPGS